MVYKVYKVYKGLAMKHAKRRTLTEEDWQAIAGQLRHAMHLLREIDGALAETLNVAEMRPYRSAFGKIQLLRSRLDALRYTQHPGWDDGNCLFYGPNWTHHAGWIA